MALNLQKGQKIDLTKGNFGLSKITVGLGWDPISQKPSGFFSSILGGGNQNFDCDASVILLDERGKFNSIENVIYFGNLKSKDGSIYHTGDNLTGEGEGDDEQIKLDLDRIPTKINRAVFVVNIYQSIQRKQHFGQVTNAYIRVINDSNNQELLKYNLSEDYQNKTTLIAGEIYRNGTEWKFGAIGEGTTDPGLKELLERFA